MVRNFINLSSFAVVRTGCGGLAQRFLLSVVLEAIPPDEVAIDWYHPF